MFGFDSYQMSTHPVQAESFVLKFQFTRINVRLQHKTQREDTIIENTTQLDDGPVQGMLSIPRASEEGPKPDTHTQTKKRFNFNINFIDHRRKWLER